MGRPDKDDAQLRDRLIAARKACADAAQRDKSLLPVIRRIDRLMEDMLPSDQRAIN